MIKDAHEIECLRLAGQATVSVYEAVYKALEEGVTQRDVESLIQAGYARVGFPGEASLNIGEYTASPHGSRTPQTIREGTIIMLDDGCRVEGYTSDITRTFVLGKPTGKMRGVFDIVKRAQKAALEAAKPGMPNEAVDAAARKVLRGYGLDRAFIHSTGHGLGLEIHEPPRLGKRDKSRLKAGMAITIEPGVYIEGFGGIRIEDTVLVTDNGCEVLTPTSKDLRII
jgi:Xaa-Pro dipeptidase